MTQHELKTSPEPFTAMWEGRKVHEYRRNDRGYDVGHTLFLREYVHIEDEDVYFCEESPPGHGGSHSGRYEEPEGTCLFCGDIFPDMYTPREMVVVVTHMNEGPDYGIPEGYAVMSVQVVERLLEGRVLVGAQ